MKEFARRDLAYERRMMPKADAMRLFEQRGEPLKVQLIEEKGGPVVSCYGIDDVFVDFCTGPHVPSTGRLKAFTVLSASNAYWKGDAKNQPMQRIYGTAFFSDADLKAHLDRLEEAKKRDHRKLGKELGLFMFHRGRRASRSGSPRAPPGEHPRQLHARHARARGLPGDAHPARLQQGAVGDLRALGALPREHVPVRDRRAGLRLEADELPGHMLVFGSEVRSYRDLPYRIHDQSVLHRYEASGVMSGLTRVREFIMDDAHIFLAEDQIGDEVERLLRIVQRVYGDFG